MKKRNSLLEDGGLFFESDTHEWFHDKSINDWAHQEDVHGTTLPDIAAFVTREKNTGQYMRVLMEKTTNEIIFDHAELEAVAIRIDVLKASKRYDESEK